MKRVLAVIAILAASLAVAAPALARARDDDRAGLQLQDPRRRSPTGGQSRLSRSVAKRGWLAHFVDHQQGQEGARVRHRRPEARQAIAPGKTAKLGAYSRHARPVSPSRSTARSAATSSSTDDAGAAIVEARLSWRGRGAARLRRALARVTGRSRTRTCAARAPSPTADLVTHGRRPARSLALPAARAARRSARSRRPRSSSATRSTRRTSARRSTRSTRAPAACAGRSCVKAPNDGPNGLRSRRPTHLRRDRHERLRTRSRAPAGASGHSGSRTGTSSSSTSRRSRRAGSSSPRRSASRPAAAGRCTRSTSAPARSAGASRRSATRGRSRPPAAAARGTRRRSAPDGRLYFGISNPGAVGRLAGAAERRHVSRARPVHRRSGRAHARARGKLLWYDQVTKHDVRDYDFEASPIVVGRSRLRRRQGGPRRRVGPRHRQAALVAARSERTCTTSARCRTQWTTVCPGLWGGVLTPMAYAHGRLFVPVVERCMRESAVDPRAPAPTTRATASSSRSPAKTGRQALVAPPRLAGDRVARPSRATSSSPPRSTATSSALATSNGRVALADADARRDQRLPERRRQPAARRRRCADAHGRRRAGTRRVRPAGRTVP